MKKRKKKSKLNHLRQLASDAVALDRRGGARVSCRIAVQAQESDSPQFRSAEAYLSTGGVDWQAGASDSSGHYQVRVLLPDSDREIRVIGEAVLSLIEPEMRLFLPFRNLAYEDEMAIARVIQTRVAPRAAPE